MIPSLLDRQVRQGVADFIRTTFSITTNSFSELINDLCRTPGQLFQGPYISLGLPFEPGQQKADYYFPELKIDFTPHKHQEESWIRLKAGYSTLVATGTGSGKTECFLYPVLDHARKQKELGWSGIKAILVYPMNALATDQARRLARTINGDPSLKGKVRAGLYIGGDQKTAAKVMGPETIVTDRETLRLDPPDILLTNYKMLDYLLLRPKDQPLWAHNQAGGGDQKPTLRYLVVDELHTFDGAQGTDLSLLIRRLKARLGCQEGQLCCVGTSATLGDSSTANQMLDYAKKIFGEPFDGDALVSESRKDVVSFLSGQALELQKSGFPTWDNRTLLDPDDSKFEDYLKKQADIWFPASKINLFEDQVALGTALRSHPVFRTLIELIGKNIRLRSEVLTDLGRSFADFEPKEIARKVGLVRTEEVTDYLELAFDSLLALVSHARAVKPNEPDKEIPLVQQVRIQSWLREMRRMVATVELAKDNKKPELAFADDLTGSDNKYLPIVYCRECGCTGWVGLLTEINGDQIETDEGFLRNFYKTFFSNKPDQKIRYFFPDMPDDNEINFKLCPKCMRYDVKTKEKCCGIKDLIPVHIPDNLAQDSKGRWFTRKTCPCCSSRNSLVLLGAQAASLSSALINQLFGSPWNNDKKLIAFSDNVQDASQRASFFGSRTWKFNFRAALQQYLRSLPDGHETPLSGLGARMLDYHRDRIGNDLETVALFLPNDISWFDEAREAKAGRINSFSDGFWKELKYRMDWEALTEYGMDCRKGRTLEKSGCSVATLKTPWNEQQLNELKVQIENSWPASRGKIEIKELDHVLWGIFRRWIHNGAIYHFSLDLYIEELGNPYRGTNRYQWKKGFGKYTTTPAFPWRSIPKADTEGRLDSIDNDSKKATSWYAHWFLKHWENLDPFILTQYETLMNFLFRSFESWGVIKRWEEQGTQLWSVNPEGLVVLKDVEQFRCDACSHSMSLSQKDVVRHLGMRCLKVGCKGHYLEAPDQGLYYGNLYNYGDIVRLFPQEHTALLKREEREEIETRFKQPEALRKPWDPNLLSCTPTLELGIDIGDLSSVLLCSVPPKQASFLQRIGRAGRKDGNAWIGTIAEGQPHDLYFWADPNEMLMGKIEPPGVFLDASAVLSRQLTAFCFDRWVQKNPQGKIPLRINTLLDQSKKNLGFYKEFIDFVNTNGSLLADDFLALLEGQCNPSTQEILRNYLSPASGGVTPTQETLVFRLNESLASARKVRKSLEDKRNEIKKDIEKLSKDPSVNKDLIEELKTEKNAFTQLIANMSKRDIWQFLTDEGLIPNYAFPEAGVQLKSIIYRRAPSTQSGVLKPRSLKEIFEYERAAATAISDFAPGNYFYAHGRKVQIDQIDMAQSQPELWRLCPECGHMELEVAGSAENPCPQCEAPDFGSKAQVQNLLRVKQVFANSSDRKSLVDDASDGREIKFFERSLLIGLRESELLGAWTTLDPEHPFGFEVRRKTALRELNFGEYDSFQAQAKLRIGGEEHTSAGFEFCKSCGKVSIEGAAIEHTFHCKRSHPKEDQVILKSVLFYRDFQGEAMRVFLPTLSMANMADAKSFLAALHLGLKLHYKGDISHLQAALQNEPVLGNSRLRKQYVVIYDVVPGGTGYLRQFVDKPSLMFDILDLALKRMTACACNQIEGKDGCYHCILAHRNSREMDLISREVAVRMVQRIVAGKDKLTPFKEGLSRISINSLLESELEKRFIDVLKNLFDNGYLGRKVVLSQQVIGAKNGWLLNIGGQDWVIEPQVAVGPADGIVVSTRIDFVLTHATNKDLKPIALYLDGWEYHHNKMNIDTLQRLALNRSGKYRVWSLGWEDLDDVQSPKDLAPGLLNSQQPDKSDDLLMKMEMGPQRSWNKWDSMRLFLEYLGKPDDALWYKWGYALLAGNTDFNEIDFEKWKEKIEPYLPGKHPGWPVAWEGFGFKKRDTHWELDGWLERPKPQRAICLLRVDDEPFQEKNLRDVWRECWRAINVFQFQADFIFVVTSAQKEGLYDGVKIDQGLAGRKADRMDAAWAEVFEMSGDLNLRHVLSEAYKKGLPVPVLLHEVSDEKGRVLGGAEIAWPNLKKAIVRFKEDQMVLEKMGWRCALLEDSFIPSLGEWWKGSK